MAIQFPALAVRVTEDPRRDQVWLNMLSTEQNALAIEAITAQTWLFSVYTATLNIGHGFA